ncbi:MAG: protein-L-isoaspartate(D-aspartate) O-methyltransferase [Lentimonas sp.]|jgi:protein-L-isoaspartate(D-aspartate) O-methyltransferase
MEDSYRHKGMRKKLVSELNKKGIEDPRILDAFNAIPRHFFLDLVFVEQAYSNIAFRIGAGQTISHPYTVAFQTSLLDLQKGHKVLEIGTGSGFQTCVLCEMGAKVFSIERQKELHLNSKKIIHHFNFNPRLSFGDGYAGWPAFEPFDSILVTCGAPFIPEELKNQLKIGGKLVIPLGEGDVQRMIRLTKISENEFEEEDFGDFSFVPMLKDKAK